VSEKPVRVGDLVKAKEITRDQVLEAVATIFDGKTAHSLPGSSPQRTTGQADTHGHPFIARVERHSVAECCSVADRGKASAASREA
jgi:hypothetical protein